MKICVIGQGYIGLPTAILFAKNGCEVVGVDINNDIIDSLNNNIVPVEEEGLQEVFESVIKSGHYTASTTPEEADVYIVTVPTLYKKENYECDLGYVINACQSIVPYLNKGNTVIIESTIAPLSTDNVVKPIFEKNGYTIGEDLYLVHCPERVLPGHIIDELVNNNRIIGGVTPACTKKAVEIYGIFVKGEMLETEAKTAELSKCMENTFRDVNIALANELVKICSKINVDALDVIQMANKHPRVNIHSPGPGVGGHCLAIDPYFIYAQAPDEAKIIKLARDTNNSMPQFVVDTTKKILSKETNDNDHKIAILGVSYKGNIDDDRESPAYSVINLLKNEYEIAIHDPHVNKDTFQSLEDTLKDASIALILTDHNEFKEPDYDLLVKKMKYPIIFDTKNIINAKKVPNEVIFYNYGNIEDM